MLVAESVQHLQLVRSVLEHIEQTYRPHTGLAIFHDLPDLLGCDKPPRIGGYVPDVYAVDAPQTITVIGEAKTAADLGTEHTKRQLTTFLCHLSQQPNGILVLSVPWHAAAAARNLLARIREEFAVTAGMIVLDGVEESRC